MRRRDNLSKRLQDATQECSDVRHEELDWIISCHARRARSHGGVRCVQRRRLADGALPRKVKELIAVAVALTTQCPYCIEIHGKEARAQGAGDAELAEVALVAAAIRAGGAVTHAAHLVRARPQAQAAK